MKEEREFVRFKTWAFNEFGPMTKEALLPLWITWCAARENLRFEKPEPMQFEDGSTLDFNTNFGELQGKK